MPNDNIRKLGRTSNKKKKKRIVLKVIERTVHLNIFRAYFV